MRKRKKKYKPIAKIFIEFTQEEDGIYDFYYRRYLSWCSQRGLFSCTYIIWLKVIKSIPDYYTGVY